MYQETAKGIDDFHKLITENKLYIDKTLFIKEFIETGDEVTLIARPRRFGKTLNLSMVKYFFDIREDYSYLFTGLNIKEYDKYSEYINKYPVIYLTLKECKQNNFDNFFEQLKLIIRDICKDYQFIETSDKLDKVDKEQFLSLKNLTASDTIYATSLKILSRMLYRYYEKPVYILLDEYDAPIQRGYLEGYHDEIVSFMQTFMGSAFKTNPSLKQGLITGVTRVSGSDLFSSFNNLETSTVLDIAYSQYFGFTKEEVMMLLNKYDLKEDYDKVKDMYDGYLFGETNIYNPWSIICYLKNPMHTLKTYWVNTGGTDILKKLIETSDNEVQEAFNNLIVNGYINDVRVNENLTFTDLNTYHDIWSFFLYAGYLTVYEFINPDEVVNLRVPNKEILKNLSDIIKRWFENNVKGFNELINSLKENDMETFKILLEEKLLQTSYYNFERESNYQTFLLGLLLSGDINITSETERGYGRCDIVASYKDNVYIFELKKVRDESLIDETIKQAFKQIEDKKYDVNFDNKKITKVVIVFVNKKFKLEYK
ncbi:MAG: AAA family ATPase [bacterium]|nr:AAA family ATPase [bacterium]